MTAREKIIMRLASVEQPLPLHALDIPGVSQTAASARLREMAREGIVVSVPVPGARYTAWTLKDLVLPISVGHHPQGDSAKGSVGSVPSSADANTQGQRGGLNHSLGGPRCFASSSTVESTATRPFAETGEAAGMPVRLG